MTQIPKENPGTATTASGVLSKETTKTSAAIANPKLGLSAMSQYANDRHKCAAWSLVYCLTLNTPDTWLDATRFWSKRLTVTEAVGLVYSVLSGLDREVAMLVTQSVLGGAGQPQAPFFGFMDQAMFCADIAEPEELDAYCLASFNRMTRARQAAFLAYVQREVAV